ncbi:glucose PTS transporter subunit IIA [Spiroplasma tabanidicola]|uniref:PTS system, beta-glucoside-specific IIABC component n=1 Tax=Spiroplasma tabanidicola TaxID=324079 RepID=A0A6I6CBM8_9MOLU|nr:glucose PTS transporter subunit IIA [Spiroplasma tabanidicola]QGS51482.1 hypothetical protein STABA_v1c01150 [Spiroplasma tabanidicola]
MKNKQSIKIYAPVDCFVNDIKELNDGVFSEGMLGIGIYFNPKNNNLYAPVEGKCVQVFNTKHAIHFEDLNGNILLMHIGIDSVQLNGEGFDIKVNPGQVVGLKNEVATVDFKLFEQKNIIKSTPIVIETDNNFEYEFKNFKPGDYKKGDLILEIEKTLIENKASENKVQKDDAGKVMPIIFKDKWEQLSEELLKGVSGKDNVTNVNNCNTRLRLQIKNMDKLSLDTVKQNRNVKGINIKGNELQIIIGPDAYKLKEVFNDYAARSMINKNAKKVKETFKSKLVKVINGILIPVVPIICAASFITLVKTIFETTHVIDQVSLDYSHGALSVLTDYDLVTGLFFILSQTAWAFVGIYFSYSTVKFLKGNTIMGILLGLTLVSPFLFSGLKWDLFTIGTWTFSVSAYPSSILPHIFVGVVYVYFDRWCRKWIPTCVDLIFRHSISYAVSILSVFLIAGPLLALLESGLYFVIIDGLTKIPFGIGTALFGFLWQPLVLTGMHTAFYVPINNMIGNGIPLVLGTVKEAGSLGQFGACVAVIFATKGSATKQIAVSSSPPALLGITEPAIYGCNLVKVIPFIAGCIGSGLGGLYFGLTDCKLYAIGNGVLSSIGTLKGGTMNFVNCWIGYVITMASAFLITFFFYKERIDEKNGIQRLYKKVIRTFELKENKKLNNLYYINKFKEIYNKEAKLKIKKLEKFLYKKGLIENKITSLIVKEDNLKQKYSKLASKYYEKNMEDKVVKYNDLILNTKIDKDKYNGKLNVFVKEILELNTDYNKISIKAKELTDSFVEGVVKELKNENLKVLKNNFNQIIMSLENNALNVPKQEELLFNFKEFVKNKKLEKKTIISK